MMLFAAFWKQDVTLFLKGLLLLFINYWAEINHVGHAWLKRTLKM